MTGAWLSSADRIIGIDSVKTRADPRPARAVLVVRSAAQDSASNAERPLFDGLYEFFRRAAVLGREPA